MVVYVMNYKFISLTNTFKTDKYIKWVLANGLPLIEKLDFGTFFQIFLYVQ